MDKLECGSLPENLHIVCLFLLNRCLVFFTSNQVCYNLQHSKTQRNSVSDIKRRKDANPHITGAGTSILRPLISSFKKRLINWKWKSTNWSLFLALHVIKEGRLLQCHYNYAENIKYIGESHETDVKINQLKRNCHDFLPWIWRPGESWAKIRQSFSGQWWSTLGQSQWCPPPRSNQRSQSRWGWAWRI